LRKKFPYDKREVYKKRVRRAGKRRERENFWPLVERDQGKKNKDFFAEKKGGTP